MTLEDLIEIAYASAIRVPAEDGDGFEDLVDFSEYGYYSTIKSREIDRIEVEFDVDSAECYIQVFFIPEAEQK